MGFELRAFCRDILKEIMTNINCFIIVVKKVKEKQVLAVLLDNDTIHLLT